MPLIGWDVWVVHDILCLLGFQGILGALSYYFSVSILDHWYIRTVVEMGRSYLTSVLIPGDHVWWLLFFTSKKNCNKYNTSNIHTFQQI